MLLTDDRGSLILVRFLESGYRYFIGASLDGCLVFGAAILS